jgi:hypothetical protein
MGTEKITDSGDESTEVEQTRPKFVYDPGKMLELTTAEQEKFSTLTPDQQLIYIIFRDSFALSSGSDVIQSAFFELLGSLNILPDSVKRLITSTVPTFILDMRAPRKHVETGKDTSDPEKNQNRLDAVRDAWRKCHDAFYRSQPDLFGLITTLIFQDQKYQVAYNGRANVKGDVINLRTTGNDINASFIREFILSSKWDSKFGTPFQQIILQLRNFLQVYHEVFLNYPDNLKNFNVIDTFIDSDNEELDETLLTILWVLGINWEAVHDLKYAHEDFFKV